MNGNLLDPISTAVHWCLLPPRVESSSEATRRSGSKATTFVARLLALAGCERLSAVLPRARLRPPRQRPTPKLARSHRATGAYAWSERGVTTTIAEGATSRRRPIADPARLIPRGTSC